MGEDSNHQLQLAAHSPTRSQWRREDDWMSLLPDMYRIHTLIEMST